MDIIGHGIDIVSIDQIGKLLEKQGGHFERRCFTVEERNTASSDSNRSQFYAGRFAAKEAVLKALGTGWSQGIAWTDIEIRRLPSGRPEVVLHAKCNEIASEQGVSELLLSISHTDSYATASVIVVGRRTETKT
jgi:holo-[acyl-carrier protein] synthase